MTSPTGFPPGTIYTITNVSQGFPGIVTVDSVAETGSFFLTNGMTFTIKDVEGMYELNRNRYTMGALDTDAMTFALYTIQGHPVDTTQFNAYIAGGKINIISYPPQAGTPPGLMYNTQPITI